MKNVKLNNGVEMPILGLGVYQMKDAGECENAVYEAITSGYRLIDTASAYENEEAVGRGIKRSGVPREELFITTKLWIQDASYEKAKTAFEKSLNKLQLDYLDLYLIHQPYGDVLGAWRAMEELYNEGKIRAIGLSNFTPARLMDLMLNSKVVPAVNQIETHPYCQQLSTQGFLKENKIQLQSWSPFAQSPELLKNNILKVIAGRHNKSVPQVILRWLIQRDVVVIPKSTHKERIVENMNVFDFELDTDDMAAITTLDTGHSTVFDGNNPANVKFLIEAKFNI